MLNDYISLSDDIQKRLDLFYDLHKNATLNLTSIKDKEQFYIKHYLDSIYFFIKYNPSFESLCDIGSGGGFPGIVIAIFYSQKPVYLVESIRKKADFLLSAVNVLGLDNVEVINDRIENIKFRSFDLFTARGVSSVLDILKKSFNVSRETSSWLLYKGKKLDDELKEAEKFIRNKGLEVRNVRIEEPFLRTYCYITNK
ncbi:MAG: 16S rRNA (guanine(527)-N(7))-methyltransferase RsmG [Deferribacterales bacterium]